MMMRFIKLIHRKENQEMRVMFHLVKLNQISNKANQNQQQKRNQEYLLVQQNQLLMLLIYQNKRTGLYQQSNILQNYQELIMKIPNTIQNTPLHVHMYENIVAHYGQSQYSDAYRYMRTIQSFLFFKQKAVLVNQWLSFYKAYCQVFLNMISRILIYIYKQFNHYKNFQVFHTQNSLIHYSNGFLILIIRKIIHIILFKIQGFFNSYSFSIKFIFNLYSYCNKYSQSEIDNIIYDISTSEVSYMQSQQGPFDYDILMYQFLEIFKKYKIRTSIKYNYLYTSIDLINKGIVDFQQWNFQYEVLCCINYSFSIRLFYQEADYCVDNGRMISKQRFTLVCDE
ncbi:unnamed protein product [Paramecium primaurelia]|uniref:Uncharacterized protein n=1 Tax=Paramecium primaurelia TaxID=5886 RepID=A0A8S1LXJ6_PARPR|nr:unnamed protein product [Paramecium primaurelia]